MPPVGEVGWFAQRTRRLTIGALLLLWSAVAAGDLLLPWPVVERGPASPEESSLTAAIVGTDAGPTPAAGRSVSIGVLSHRGDAITEATWGPTADYLTAALPGWCFRIEPLDFAEVEPAVAARTVDFLLVNPSIYVELEVEHRIARIATMRNGTGGQERNVFGGVIFTRADRADIDTLDDLKGKRLMAVAPTSLGGWQVARAELLNHGIEPHRDLSELVFAGIHDAVVLAVRDGRVDAGIVRTDILERMVDSGMIVLADFRILNPRHDDGFPLLHSTPLYPEWPFSRVPGTPQELAQQVAIALMQMPRDEAAALAGGYAGWTVPLDYQPVHRLLRELKRPPYDALGRFTLVDALVRYWPAVLIGVGALLVMLALTSRVMHLNAHLSRAKSRLERRQELILNSVAEGIYGVDLNGRTTFVNRAMEQLTGWRADQLIGCDQHEVLHHTHGNGDPHPREDCPVYATYRDDRPRFIEDDVFWRRDGTSFPVEYSTTPIRDERGRTVGSVVVFRDTTERHEAAERIRRLEKEQAHVARLSTLGEIASGIAHELNQPLTAISTNARACVRMITSARGSLETCAEVMAKTAEQAERAGEVIRHIRRFVRKEAPETRPVAVADLFESVLVLLRRDARRHGVAMSCCIGYGVAAVRVQPTQIEQVLLNLAHNAIEAMAGLASPVGDGRHRLAMTARRRQNKVLIRVADTGPGVAAAVRERLFEPFITNKPDGPGLGLSISAGIIEHHGARLSLTEPTAGGGACFCFSLPVAASAAPARPPTETEVSDSELPSSHSLPLLPRRETT
jgi:two-component system sensor histidine kinase TtrS